MPGDPSTPPPRRNRVTPGSDIVAIPARGAWTGNRGCLHRDGEVVRRWASHHWLVCALHFKDWWHEQWVPGRLTWLYFHDEAVAFAAGHRPCALCRRPAYNAYRAALSSVTGRAPGADELDRRLHRERLAEPGAAAGAGSGADAAAGNTRRRRLHPVAWTELVDGAFVIDGDRPALVVGDRLVDWSPAGYGEPRRRPRAGTAQLLTPPATLTVLRAGYPVQIAGRTQ